MNFKKILSSSFIFGALLVGASAGFAMISEKGLDDLFPDQGVAKGYTVQLFTNRKNTYLLQTYPVSVNTTPEDNQNCRAPGRYAPLRGNGTDAKLMDCVVVTQWGGAADSKLGSILETWKNNGLSSHWIVGKEKEPVVVRFVDSHVSEAQMAGTWNEHSVEIMIHTDGDQKANTSQIEALKEIVAYSNRNYNTKIKFLGDYREAKSSGDAGKITNIGTIRAALDLQELSSLQK